MRHLLISIIAFLGFRGQGRAQMADEKLTLGGYFIQWSRFCDRSVFGVMDVPPSDESKKDTDITQ
jgi:GH18 family chitinase